jgi:hypothetical protein
LLTRLLRNQPITWSGTVERAAVTDPLSQRGGTLGQLLDYILAQLTAGVVAPGSLAIAATPGVRRPSTGRGDVMSGGRLLITT